MRSIVAFLVLPAIAAAKKAAEEAPAGNPLVDYVMGIVTPLYESSLGLASDALSLTIGVPNQCVSLYTWSIDQVRDLPALGKSLIDGDAGTLKDLSSFAADMAGTIFCVYAGLTALNLGLGLLISVKEYFHSYMTLPTSLPILGKLPPAVMKIRNKIQVETFDRVKRFSVSGWVVPLEGQSGKSSLAQALPVLASATSICVLLGAAPAIHALIKKGADKAAAESLAYTLGMAVGLQYLVKRV